MPKRQQSRVGGKFDRCVAKVSPTNPDGAKAICASALNKKYPGALQRAAAKARRARVNPSPDPSRYAEEFGAPYGGTSLYVLRWYDPETYRGYTLQWFTKDFVAQFYRSEPRKDGNPSWGWKTAGPQHEMSLRGGRLDVTADHMRDLGMAGYQTLLQMAERMRELMKARPRANPSAFDKCVASVQGRSGVYDPRGLCAFIGREKYGAKGMARKARRARANPVTSPGERFRDCVDAENENPGLEDPADLCAAKLARDNPARRNPAQTFSSVDVEDVRLLRGRRVAPGYVAAAHPDGTYRVTRAWFERHGAAWEPVAKLGNAAVIDVTSDGHASARHPAKLHGDDVRRMPEFVEAILESLVD